MMSFLRTQKHNAKLLAVITICILALVLVGVFARGQLCNQSPQVSAVDTSTLDLGFSYLNITPKLAAYYGLGASSGALVTEVSAGSQADQAGIKPGDIILSFNSSRVESGAPLYGMMRACPVGNQIVLEVWRGETDRLIEFIHMPR